jgi:hypothetical protein
VIEQCLDTPGRQGDGAPGFAGLRVATHADRAPDPWRAAGRAGRCRADRSGRGGSRSTPAVPRCGRR